MGVGGNEPDCPELDLTNHCQTTILTTNNGTMPNNVLSMNNQPPMLTQWLPPSSIHFLHLQCDESQTIAAKPSNRANNVKHWTGHQNNNKQNNGNYSNNNKLLKTGTGIRQPLNNNLETILQMEDDEIEKTVGHGNGSDVSSIPLCLAKKLQVTEKDGSFIALDNNSLQLMRRLEKMGHCSRVEVEIVPLSKVPPNIVKTIFHHHHPKQSNNQHQSLNRFTESSENNSPNNSNTNNGFVSVQINDNDNNNCNSDETKKRCSTIKSSPDNCLTCLRKMASSEMEPCSNRYIEETAGTALNKGNQNQCKANGNDLMPVTKSVMGAMFGQFNTYLSDQQLRQTRMTNTMVVMAPCLRQPIITSTPSASGLHNHVNGHLQHKGSSSASIGCQCCNNNHLTSCCHQGPG